MNQTLKEIIKADHEVGHIHDLLTFSSRIYFQTYFEPTILVHKEVREMYLNIKTKRGIVPMLLNANKRGDAVECVLVKMETRDEYENQLMKAKKKAEQIQAETVNANKELLKLLAELAQRQNELTELNKELKEMAEIDALTGLYNRRIFQSNLKEAIDHACAVEEAGLTLLLLDIDYFKKINDSYGHLIGDEVLKEAAKKLKKVISSTHLVARIGGEEFAILFYRLTLNEAIEQTKELHQFMNGTKWDSQAITFSMGMAQYRQGDTLNSLFSRADEALYKSKSDGRDRLTVL